MPIYEYQCSSCGRKTEVLQKLSDAPLRDCPACGEPALTKLVSAAGFQLKGSGWYATDFKGGKPAASKQPDAGKPADGAKAAGTDKPAEAKPKEESKPESSAGGAAAAGQ
ncbi:MAG TPA: zinc ribbon domain-containing protein [Burkholderiales bacterium]|nr:zinc ribbon domain-containing protein [Burkholderiales bacterium]